MKRHIYILLPALLLLAMQSLMAHNGECTSHNYLNSRPAFDIIFNAPYGAPIEMPEKHLCNHKHHTLLDGESNIVRRNYDVLNYELVLDWTPLFTGPDTTFESTTWQGRTIIKLVIDSADVTTIEFDSKVQNDSVIFEDILLPITEDNGEIVRVDITGLNKVQGDTIELSVYYTCKNVNKGIYQSPKNLAVNRRNSDPVKITYTAEKLVYTQCEPHYTSFWWVGNHRLYDKAFFKTTITVPDDIIVSSNGTLMDTTIVVDEETFNRKTFHFESAYKMAMYLVVVNASKFHYASEIYSNDERDIPFNYYLWEADLDGEGEGKFDFNKSFSNHLSMMSIYEDFFGPYPFESYGITVADPYEFGGMEHQTMTTVNRTWLWNAAATGIAHELTHQWLGDYITCATWQDIWINEGGASWGEALWLLGQYEVQGQKYYDQQMARHKRTYQAYIQYLGDEIRNHAIYDVEGESAFYTYSSLVYSKAAWVYHMLYEWSDHSFKEALQGIMLQHEYTSIETEDFKNTLLSMNFVFPIDLETYFDQWIYSGGHPVYSITGTPEKKQKDSTYSNYLSIIQIQEGSEIPQEFDVMQRITLFDYNDPPNQATFTFRNHERIQDTMFVTDFEAKFCILDETYSLFETEGGLDTFYFNPLSVKEEGKSNITLMPSPVNSGENTSLTFTEASITDTDVIIYDATGKQVNRLIHPAGNHILNIPTNGLSQGIYFIRIQNKENFEAIKMIVN